MKFLTPAHGAEIRRVDSIGRYSGFFQLPPISLGQVDVPPSLPSEMRRDFRTDLVAAFPDAGSDGSMQILGPRAEALPHRRDRACDDLRDSAAPPCVDRGDSMQA